MMPIDYPADFEAIVGAALAHPCIIDSRGNLYELRDDASTVLVAGPETGGNVRFQGAGSGGELAWAAAQERLFVRFGESAQTIQAALPRAGSGGNLPEYRRSALTVVSPSSAYLVHNTEEALYCFSVTRDGIRLCAKIEGYKGYGVMKEGGDLYVFGMHTRVHKIVKPWFSKTEGFSLKYGIGALLRIDLPNGCVETSAATKTKKALVAAWKADAHETEDRYVRPLLEVWLDSFETAKGRVLIGGVMDERLPEFDDTFEEPHPADFAGIALYRWKEGASAELLRLLRGVRYTGRMKGPKGELLYFSKQKDPRNAFTEHVLALQVSADMQSPLLPVAFDWAEENLLTVQFDPIHDARVGVVAAVTTKIRNVPLPYRRHIATSDDGFTWRFVHALPEQLQNP